MSEKPPRISLPMVAGCGLMVLGAAGVLAFICAYGQTLTAPLAEAAPAAAEVTGHSGILLQVLLALGAVVAAGLVLGKLFGYLGQPPVIGEVVAGIALGPSLLGPQASALVLPPSAAPYLGIVAQLGVLLYMFIVGLDLHAGAVRYRAHAIAAISLTSIVVPFLLGALLALVLYTRFADPSVPFTSFALFLGIALSVTAFPVLARILDDWKLSRTELGVTALSCAATGDLAAWCLLALVVGVAQAQVGEGLVVVGWARGYIGLMLVGVRPLLRRLVARWEGEELPRAAVALVFLALLLSALATEWIGIHAIFGAFLLGALIPHQSAVARTFSRQLQSVVTVLLLPAFFAYTGMRTRINLVSGVEQWLLCGAIILVATVGKFGGTLVAARLTGLGWRSSAALGALMNTRGLMELIVLNIGLDLGVISPALFSMLVLMALVTTMMTAPALRLWLPPPVAV